MTRRRVVIALLVAFAAVCTFIVLFTWLGTGSGSSDVGPPGTFALS